MFMNYSLNVMDEELKAKNRDLRSHNFGLQNTSQMWSLIKKIISLFSSCGSFYI
uniref:Uncharacterized protein n=1 Tax=Lepeophtheirus salmonis TaxID=72036 RepID=A0A0K2V547_LEPSM